MEETTPEKQPKKRGRKPKSAAAATPEESVVKQPKRRGRPPKAKQAEGNLASPEQMPETPVAAPTGPQWRDAPEPVAETESEQTRDESIFVPSTDDFAYASQAADDQSSDSRSDGEFRADDDIPTSYSTTDEDLVQDNYKNSWSYDDERDESPAKQDFEAESPDGESSERFQRGDSEDRFQRRDDSRNHQSRNSNNKWQQRQNNGFNKNQNRNQNGNRQNQQQAGQNNRFNRNQNGNRQNQQNQNRNPNQRNNQNRQQNQQPQNANRNQQRQNKPKWLQQSAEADFINPSELFNWSALESDASIGAYVAEKYLGIAPAAPAADAAQPDQPIPAQTAPDSVQPQEGNLENSAAQPDAENFAQSQGAPQQTSAEPAAQPAQQSAQEQPSGEANAPLPYWEMLEKTNAALLDESSPKQQPQPERAENADAPAQAENKPADAPFVESPEFEVGGARVASLDIFDEFYPKTLPEIREYFEQNNIPHGGGMNKNSFLADYFKYADSQKKLTLVSGVLDVFEDGFGGAITFASDDYRLKKYSVFVPKFFVEKYSLARGHFVRVLAASPKDAGGCPFAVKICSVMGRNPASIKDIEAFNDLTPYYPTERIILESDVHTAKANVSMRAVDLLSPIGFGQRALIVAPPRTGKTVLMQSMAKSIRYNKPEARLIVLLVDERPEEVTDFKRSVDAEVVASTFDEDAASHVHAAEMVISKARRLVETGENVVILLDSITRLARAYNALMPNGGRTMSGGVEANALQKPKKFFGSARNIEGGGSLTIIGTALVETGSKMDEVIFEEFKGTGNLELHLDRALSEKRIFPAINMEKTGTRKEELLYHPDELEKIYMLRRAMNGVPIVESMEMLVQRLKKTKTNVEFLLGLNR